MAHLIIVSPDRRVGTFLQAALGMLEHSSAYLDSLAATEQFCTQVRAQPIDLALVDFSMFDGRATNPSLSFIQKVIPNGVRTIALPGLVASEGQRVGDAFGKTPAIAQFLLCVNTVLNGSSRSYRPDISRGHLRVVGDK